MTDLDRLLGIFHSNILRLDNNFGFSVSEMEEINNLKSQLESKLAESDRISKLQIENSEYPEIFVEKHNAFLNKDGTPNDESWQAKEGQYQYRIASVHYKTEQEAREKLKFILNLQQIQSQHTNLVKAIQDRIKVLELAKLELHPANNQHLIWTKNIEELQNLLESTKRPTTCLKD